MNELMTRFFASGHVADVALAVIVIEGLALGLRRGGGKPALADMLPTLLAGACLALALRGALLAADWPWIAGPLSGALLAHVWDLRRRWQGEPPRSR